VLEAIRAYAGRLGEVERALAARDRRWLLDFVAEAATGRERLLAADRDPAGEPWRITVVVPNRPGAISEIATALGHAHINIEDLVLRPGVSGGGGELALVVAGEEAATRAVALVTARGYRAGAVPAPA
jgi:hypothetical protein